MSLPPRVLYPLPEVAARWGCSIADVAAWAATGKLEMVTGIAPTTIGSAQVAGLAVIAVADILPMFRPCGTGPTSCEVRRMRSLGEEEWIVVPSGQDGIQVARADIVIMADEVSRFEDAHGLFRRRPGGGSLERRYDWDGFYMAMILHIHDNGVPATLNELVAEMQEWFIEQTDEGPVPEESTIRKRVSPIWRELRARP